MSYQDLDSTGGDPLAASAGPSNKKKSLLAVILIVTAILLATGVTTAIIVGQQSQLANRIKIANLMGHLEALEDIAMANGGTRMVASTGYNASIDYVVDQLAAAKTELDVVIQHFPVTTWTQTAEPVLQETAPGTIEFTVNVEYNVMTGSGSGAAAAESEGPVGKYGCSTADYEGFTADAIALVSRGGVDENGEACGFVEKAQFATEAGASALIIYNEGNTPDREGLVLGQISPPTDLPVLGATFAIGQAMLAVPTTLSLETYTVVETRYTSNVIAQTLHGRTDRVVLVGSHLDSVPAGPGINDNGSGSAANLEMAIRWGKRRPHNQIRFCWWGAEEIGLLGSTHYVNDLVENDPDELKNIALNLNFDMLASPNYFRGIYNGSGASEDIRVQSEAIQFEFEDYLNKKELNFSLTEFNGRSDYGPFIAVGIPAGGLAAGAEVLKTMEEREMFGGLANAAYDPCYHQQCDTVANIDQGCFTELTQAAAHVLQTLAMKEDLDELLGVPEAKREAGRLANPTEAHRKALDDTVKTHWREHHGLHSL